MDASRFGPCEMINVDVDEDEFSFHPKAAASPIYTTSRCRTVGSQVTRLDDSENFHVYHPIQGLRPLHPVVAETDRQTLTSLRRLR